MAALWSSVAPDAGGPTDRARVRLVWALVATVLGLCLLTPSLWQRLTAGATLEAAELGACGALELHLARKAEHILTPLLGADAFVIEVNVEMPDPDTAGVRRVTVAAAVDGVREAHELQQIEFVLADALGLVAARGDAIHVVGMPFVEAPVHRAVPSQRTLQLLGMVLLLLAAMGAASAWTTRPVTGGEDLPSPRGDSPAAQAEPPDWADTDPDAMAKVLAAFATRED